MTSLIKPKCLWGLGNMRYRHVLLKHYRLLNFYLMSKVAVKLVTVYLNFEIQDFMPVAQTLEEEIISLP